MPETISAVLHKITTRSTSQMHARSPITLEKPPAASLVERRLLEHGFDVPEELRALYSIVGSIGMDDFRICSIEETYWHLPDLLVLHIWGNGDVDCARVGDIRKCDVSVECPVIFCGHDPSVAGEICPSIGQWISELLVEYDSYGFISHPYDCYRNKWSNRLYSRIHYASL